MFMIGIIAAAVVGATPPKRLPGFALAADDYPAFARRYEHAGAVGFTASIDAAGLPHDCVVTASSSFAELDAKTCELVAARMRFVPARDEHGAATGGTYSGRIRWKLDGSQPSPFGDGTTKQTVAFAPDGTIAHCSVEASGVMAGPPNSSCEAELTTLLPLVLGVPLTGLTTATVITAVRAGDTVAAPDTNGYGVRHFGLTARFAVNADGRVEQCTPDREVIAHNRIVDVCAVIFAGQTQTVAAFGPGAAQRGMVAIYIYGLPRPVTLLPTPSPRP